MSNQTETIDIWIIHSEKRILVTDLPGPPAVVCGYVSAEAAQASKERGYPTVSEVGFPVDCYFQALDWQAGMALAREKAAMMGYEIETSSWLDIAASQAFGEEGEEYQDRTCGTCGGEFGDGWTSCSCEDLGDPDFDEDWKYLEPEF